MTTYAGDWSQCLDWYKQSLRLFMYGVDEENVKIYKERAENIAKLHRNRAACFLNLEKMEEVSE